VGSRLLGEGEDEGRSRSRCRRGRLGGDNALTPAQKLGPGGDDIHQLGDEGMELRGFPWGGAQEREHCGRFVGDGAPVGATGGLRTGDGRRGDAKEAKGKDDVIGEVSLKIQKETQPCETSVFSGSDDSGLGTPS